MPILDTLLDTLPANRAVRSVHVGIHWTAVCLDAGPEGGPPRCGLASTLGPVESPGHQHEHGHGSVLDAGDLCDFSAHELAARALSHSGPERSIGWAAINALIAPDESLSVELNARDFLLERGAGKRIAMVGHFPFVEALRMRSESLAILEQRPAPGDQPASAAPEVLPEADIVAITSLTLVNGTFEGLARLWRPDAVVMMLGPSTPFSPLLFERGIDVLSGTVVDDPPAAIQTLCQGASFRQMRGVRLMTMARAGLSE
jgi:uncharacterized protein (DUF4213/DUF364 family)